LNNILPQSVNNLIENLQHLPWVWEKTAQRLAFFMMKKNENFLKNFWDSVSDLKKNIKECKKCCNFTENEICWICENPTRNEKIICIVENPFDVIALEKAMIFKWQYHVLHWVLSPLDGVWPENLRIEELIKRIWETNLEEIILAINPSLEGEATSMYIWRKIWEAWFKNIKISTLARWISVWWDLEYTDELTLWKALENRIIF